MGRQAEARAARNASRMRIRFVRSDEFVASFGGRRRCRSRSRLARGDQAAEQARRIKQRPRSASAQVNRSLGHELGRVRERGRDDLGIRVGELRDRGQRKFKLAQLSRRFWPKYFDLAFLACSNRCQLVALAPVSAILLRVYPPA